MAITDDETTRGNFVGRKNDGQIQLFFKLPYLLCDAGLFHLEFPI